jgi:hypothetical protein
VRGTASHGLIGMAEAYVLWPSGTSFRAGLSVLTDECVEYSCVLFAYDALIVGLGPFLEPSDALV